MKSKIEIPSWYPKDIYSKTLSVEEWTYEIWKRYRFSQGNILPGIPSQELPIKHQIQQFETFVFADCINEFLSKLNSNPPKPIKPTSVSDAFRMVGLIKNSSWYESQPDKEIFETASDILNKGGVLNQQQKEVHFKYSDMPWHTFHENSPQDSWYPNKDLTHLTGIQLSIDPSFNKEDIAKHLKSLLKKWLGRKEDIGEKFETWQEYQVLAVFDLTTWFTLLNLPYKKIDIYSLIWPEGRISPTSHEEVNPYDDIDSIIKEMKKTISSNSVRELLLACENHLHNK